MSQQQGEAAVWTAGQQSTYHGDAPGSASQRHTPHPVSFLPISILSVNSLLYSACEVLSMKWHGETASCQMLANASPNYGPHPQDVKLVAKLTMPH